MACSWGLVLKDCVILLHTVWSNFCVKRITTWDLRFEIISIEKGTLGRIFKRLIILKAFLIFPITLHMAGLQFPRNFFKIRSCFLFHCHFHGPSACPHLSGMLPKCPIPSSKLLVSYSSSQKSLQIPGLDYPQAPKQSPFFRLCYTFLSFPKQRKVVLCMKLNFIGILNASLLVWPKWITVGSGSAAFTLQNGLAGWDV